jgi:ribosomal protein L12E/L44/L45/RPP1/RPP2
MGLSYGWQKFHAAIHSLTGSEPLSQRIINAYAYSLVHLKDEDVPSEMLKKFNQFKKNITSVEAKGDEGTIAATVNSLSDEQLQKVAEQIVSMHDTVTRAYGTHG